MPSTKASENPSFAWKEGEGECSFTKEKPKERGTKYPNPNHNLIQFLTGFVWALTLSMYSVKKSFLVVPSNSGKEVSRVDLKKFLVKSCKDKDKDKDNDGKDVKVDMNFENSLKRICQHML